MYSAGQCLKQFASTDIARDLAAAVPAVVERKWSAAAVGHFLWPLLCCLASDVVQLLYWSMSGSSGASTSRSVEALSSFSPWPRTLLKTPSPPPTPPPPTHTHNSQLSPQLLYWLILSQVQIAVIHMLKVTLQVHSASLINCHLLQNRFTTWCSVLLHLFDFFFFFFLTCGIQYSGGCLGQRGWGHNYVWFLLKGTSLIKMIDPTKNFFFFFFFFFF